MIFRAQILLPTHLAIQASLPCIPVISWITVVSASYPPIRPPANTSSTHRLSTDLRHYQTSPVSSSGYKLLAHLGPKVNCQHDQLWYLKYPPLLFLFFVFLPIINVTSCSTYPCLGLCHFFFMFLRSV